MDKVKIIGAGSIGNHLAHAARCLGCSVVLCDIDRAALERTREEIYPARYGSWDESIELCLVSDAPTSIFDLVVVGTPPDFHIPVALEALAERPRALLVEKPVCTPDLRGAEELHRRAEDQGVRVFVGYDHVVSQAAGEARARAHSLGRVLTLDVEFREHWGGIFAAHPWLAGPQDSYLGFWTRGGGASGEHSHAINLWQELAHHHGAGRVQHVTASLDYVEDGTVDYDQLCCLQLLTENGLLGRVVQDVVTSPPRKWARIQGEAGSLEMELGVPEGGDRVSSRLEGGEPDTLHLPKTRPDDFIQELSHIGAVLEGREASTPISLERGLDTMMVVAASHISTRERRSVEIDWSRGYVPEALQMSGKALKGT